MQRIKSKNKLFLSFILSVLLFFPVFLSAQNNDPKNSNNPKSSDFVIYPVKQLTQELNKNVNLTEDQSPKVKEILRQYEADTYDSKGNKEEANEAANDAQENIAGILTDNQKTKWQKVKNDWWSKVDKELNLSDLNAGNNNKM